MGKLNQNKGAKVHEMTPKHRAGGEALKPMAGSTAVKFKGTTVHSDAGVGVTKPAKHNAGSHDDKVRVHGGDGE
jgi:hypothetical protein